MNWIFLLKLLENVIAWLVNESLKDLLSCLEIEDSLKQIIERCDAYRRRSKTHRKKNLLKRMTLKRRIDLKIHLENWGSLLKRSHVPLCFSSFGQWCEFVSSVNASTLSELLFVWCSLTLVGRWCLKMNLWSRLSDHSDKLRSESIPLVRRSSYSMPFWSCHSYNDRHLLAIYGPTTAEFSANFVTDPDERCFNPSCDVTHHVLHFTFCFNKLFQSAKVEGNI